MLTRLRRHASYANVTATLALIVALGGTSWAAVTITGRQVRDGSLTGADLRNKSVTGRDLRDKSVTGTDLRDGSVTGRDLKAGSIPLNRLQRPPSGVSGSGVATVTATTSPSGPAGGALTGSFPNPRLAGSTVGSGEVADGSLRATDLGPLPHARLSRSTPQSIPINVTTSVSFNAEVSDAFGMHADGDSPRLTLPMTGTYVITAGVRMPIPSPPSGRRFASIQLNGATELASDLRQVANTSGVSHLTSIAAVRRLSAGDFLELRVSVTGFEAPVEPGEQTHLAVAWVGP